MNTVFDAMQTFNAIGLLIGGLIMFAIGFAMIADWVLWRVKSYNVTARVAAVRATGKRRSEEEWKKHYQDELAAEAAKEKSQQSLKESFREKPIATGFVCLLLSLFATMPFAFFGFGAYTAYDFLSLQANGVKVLGTVVDVEESYDSENGYTYAPVMSYQDSSGYTYRETDRIGSGSNKISTGQKLFLYYDRDDPSHFVLDRFWRYMGLAFAFMGISSVFIGLFALGLFGIKKDDQGMTSRKLDAHKRKHYANQMYTAIYEFVTPQGETVQAPGSISSSSIADKLPGSKAKIMVRPDKPEKVQRKNLLFLIIGLVFVTPGAVMLYFGFANMAFTLGGFAMIGVAIAYFGFKVFKALRKFERVVPREDWVKQIKERTAKEIESGYVLTSEEIRDRYRAHQSAMRFSVPIIFVIAMGMMYGGHYWNNNINEFMATALPSQGEIVEMRGRSSDDGYVYHAVVSFKDDSGKAVKFEDNVGSSHPLKKRGDIVDVLYNPARPKDAMIDRGIFNSLPALGLMGLGFLFFVNGFYLWRKQRTARV